MAENTGIMRKQQGGGGKFLNVEFLRFIFSVFIVILHFCCIHFAKFGDIGDIIGKNSVVKHGYLAVQYFFIIAGFFLIYTLNKNLTVMDFIKKKIVRLWPLMALNFVLFLMASGFGIVKFNFYKYVFSLLLLENIGVTFDHTIQGGWFVSVLFFVSLFYFYIFKYFDKKYYNFYIPILVILGYTYMVHGTNGAIGAQLQIIGEVFNGGVIQGISAMGLGFLIHEFYRYLETQNYIETLKSKIIYTLLEGYLLGFVVYETIMHKIHFKNLLILVIAFCGLFITFLLQRGYISKILNNKISGILGRYAYSLFLTHGFVIILFNYFYVKKNTDILFNHPYEILGIAIILALIFAVLVYHLVEVPAGKWLKKKFFPAN